MEKFEVTKEMIKKLLNGTINDQEVLRLQNAYKDEDRFIKYLEVLQERVPWKDRILLRVSEHVYVVANKAKQVVYKCSCGHEFGDYRVNWKLECLINVRKTLAEMSEVYSPAPACPEPEWQEIREFFCPTCAAQLAVEVVPPGYPVMFEFLPDLPGFYRQLGTPLGAVLTGVHEDQSLTYTQEWMEV